MTPIPKKLRGYHCGEVDAFLARCETTSVTVDEVNNVTFRTVLKGYDPNVVDGLLDEVIAKLR